MGISLLTSLMRQLVCLSTCYILCAYLWCSTKCICCAHAFNSFFTKSKVRQSYVTLIIKQNTSTLYHQIIGLKIFKVHLYLNDNVQTFVLNENLIYLGIKKDVFWFEISKNKINRPKMKNQMKLIKHFIKHSKHEQKFDLKLFFTVNSNLHLFT